MTRIGLISDVHGDPLALELAWSHLTLLGAERIVCAGDLVGYGPEPDAVARFIDDRSIATARGNHDRWAVERGEGVPDEYGGGVPSAATLGFLERLSPGLVLEGAGRVGLVVHGSPRDDLEFIARRSHGPEILRGYLAELGADLLVFGHTHTPMWYRCDRGLVVNPGSIVSAPIVKTSSTFAIVDLATLTPRFYAVETGRPVAVRAWEATVDADPGPDGST